MHNSITQQVVIQQMVEMFHLPDSNITYGTSVGGITTSRVGVVTITQDGHTLYFGVVTAYSFSGDISGNLTGNVTEHNQLATP